MKKSKIYSALFYGASMFLLQSDLHSMWSQDFKEVMEQTNRNQSNDAVAHNCNVFSNHQNLYIQKMKTTVENFNVQARQCNISQIDTNTTELDLKNKLYHLQENTRCELLQTIGDMT